MDGNGRWAKRRHRPRSFGHQAGVESAQRVTEACAERGVKALTLFAFSSENWKRPTREVDRLMELFTRALQKEVESLRESGIRLRFIGDLSRFSEELRNGMLTAQESTRENARMDLAVAVNYGGRWDITQAAARLNEERMAVGEVTEATFGARLCLADLPEPDLFIRTGGERRISNFLLWQLAYTELYFTDTLWPDFSTDELDLALADYSARQRRFGRTASQANKQRRA